MGMTSSANDVTTDKKPVDVKEKVAERGFSELEEGKDTSSDAAKKDDTLSQKSSGAAIPGGFYVPPVDENSISEHAQVEQQLHEKDASLSNTHQSTKENGLTKERIEKFAHRKMDEQNNEEKEKKQEDSNSGLTKEKVFRYSHGT